MKKEVYIMHNLTVSMIDAWQLERPNSADIYHKTKIILSDLLEEAMQKPEFRERYLNWLNQKTYTIELRDLCRIVGHDYWEDLINTNAINFIDSCRLWWYGKQEDLITEKIEAS